MAHYTDEREGSPMKRKLSAAVKHRRTVAQERKHQAEKKRRLATMYGAGPKVLGEFTIRLAEQEVRLMEQYRADFTKQMRARPGWENLREYTMEEVITAAVREWMVQRAAQAVAACRVPGAGVPAVSADRVLSPQEITRVADKLAGTADSVDEVLMEMFGVDCTGVAYDSLRLFDSLVFRCTTCDWWCRDSERGADQETCLECEGEGA